MEVSKIEIKSGVYPIKDSVSRQKVETLENVVSQHTKDIEDLVEQTQYNSNNIEFLSKNETHYGGYGNRKFIAHRGLSALAPDNSAEGIVLASRQGFWGCEIDVRETLDGVFVLAHDDELEAWSTGSGKVSTSSWAYLQTLKIKTHTHIAGFEDVKIPSLNDILILVKSLNLHLFIEIKQINNVENFIALIDRFNMMNHVSLLDFSLDNLIAYRQLAPTTLLQHLSWNYLPENLAAYKNNKISLSLNIASITKDVVAEIKYSGLEIGAWTVNSLANLKKANDLMVDYITSNWAIWQSENTKAKPLFLQFNNANGSVPFVDKYYFTMENPAVGGSTRILLSTKYIVPYSGIIPIPTLKGYEFAIHCYTVDDIYTEEFGWLGYANGSVNCKDPNSAVYRLYVRRIGDLKFTPKTLQLLEGVQ